MSIRFGELRECLSCTDRVSICMHETTNYYNYRFIRNVPHSFDGCYVYGVGMIESEFDREPEPDMGKLEGPDSPARMGTKDFTFERCLEIRLSMNPYFETVGKDAAGREGSSIIIYHRTYAQKFEDLEKEFPDCRYLVRPVLWNESDQRGYLIAVSPSPEADKELIAYGDKLPCPYEYRGRYKDNMRPLTEQELQELFNW